MALIVLMMVGCPLFYDSKRAVLAHMHNADRTSEQRNQVIEDAKRLDRRDIMVFEFMMLGVFGLSVYAFTRAGKRALHNAG